MKKQLLNLSLIAGAIMLFASTAFATPAAPVKTADVPAITSVPVIDGLASETFWSPDQELTRFSEAENDWDGDADLSATFKFAWGWSYFYVFVNITDEVEHNWNGADGNSYEFDNIELFFQLDTNTVTTAYSDNTIQMRFNRGDAGWQSSTFRTDQTVDNYISYWENTAGGWVLEAAVPWTNILPSGALPEELDDYLPLIGFDLSIADSDGTDPLVGARSTGSQMAWDEDGEEGDITGGEEDGAWNNTSVFGYVTLVGDPVESTGTPVAEAGINVYPNPALNTVTFSGIESGSIAIYSITGSLVMEINDVTANTTVDISALSSGVYVARVGAEAVQFVVR
jgi:hypothetical protein